MINKRKYIPFIVSLLMVTTVFNGLSIQSESENRDDFTDYNELTDELQDIAATYPNIANLYELGTSIQGRSIWGLKITDNPDIEENEVEIQFDGCHHGDEYMSVEMPLNLAWHLVENYSLNSTITDLVDNREIWIVPLVNPDGRQMNQRTNANGVDLNRDYGYMHGGSSPGPFSQPETQVMREHQLENNMLLSYSYHTTAEYVNYVWDYKPQACPDEPWIDMISQVYADYSGYVKTQGFEWYQTTGASDDGNYGCFSNINTIIETLNSDISYSWDRNRDAMLYAIDVCDMGLSGVVTDASTGEPINATIWVEENNWPVFTDPIIGDYHKPLFEGTYTVHFRANGYEEQTHNIEITDANATNTFDVALVPSDEYYAHRVTLCEYFDYNDNPTEGISALGPPDDISASLGTDGMMVLDMGESTPITDNADDDFSVYEATGVDEDYTVSVSNSWNGPWTTLGSATGTASFDLSIVGMDSARFVKIEDDGTGSDDTYPGFDLDAIQFDSPYIPEHDIMVSSLSVSSIIPHGETQNVSALVKNNGNNTETGITVNFTVNETVIDSTTISSLESMDSTMVSFTWDPDYGTHLVGINAAFVENEENLLNNQVNKTVDVVSSSAINITPSSFSFMMPTDATDSELLTIENLASAEATLTYDITCTGDLSGSWLSTNPTSGSVPIDDSDSVTVTVDSTGLSEGEYQGSLIIDTNDVNDEQLIVPINMTVVFGNDLKAVSVNSPVGSVPYGSYNVNATVQNMGFYDQTDVSVNCSIYEGFLDYFEDFEAGNGEYTQSGGLWEYGSPSDGPTDAYSGSFCWGTNLDDDYGSDADATLDSAEIMIPNGVTATLSFYQWFDIESGYDGGNVKVSVDDGNTWSLISPVGGYPDDSASGGNEGIPGEPCFTGSASSWQQVSFDLTGFADETIRLRWHFGSDGSVTNPGWFIDNVEITGDYGTAKSDNTLIFSTTEQVSINAYQTKDIIFNPAWIAGGGNYTIQVTAMLPGDEDESNDVVSDVVFVSGPSLSYDPQSYNAGSMMVNTTDSTSFEVWNNGVGTLSYTLSESCDWVELSSYSGDSTGEHDTINVDIDTTGLSVGQSYTCDVNISSDGGNGVFTVSVYVVDDSIPVEDVNQSAFNRGFPIRHAIDGDWAGAQSFIPMMNVITGVDLYLRSFGTPEFDLTVELREDGPEGILLDSVTFSPSEVSSSWSWFSVDFADVAVSSGTDYFIVCPPAPVGVTSSFGYEWGYAFNNQYDDGSFWFTRDGGSLWRDLPAMYEFTFRTFGLM